jgi:hypothetical protein
VTLAFLTNIVIGVLPIPILTIVHANEDICTSVLGGTVLLVFVCNFVFLLLHGRAMGRAAQEISKLPHP